MIFKSVPSSSYLQNRIAFRRYRLTIVIFGHWSTNIGGLDDYCEYLEPNTFLEYQCIWVQAVGCHRQTGRGWLAGLPELDRFVAF